MANHKYGPPERVYVENDWYDGPRAGVADIGGSPHRFKSPFGESEDDYLGTFVVWPIDTEQLDLEMEQWRIFIGWNMLYEAGRADVDSHPGHGGRSARWDEIEKLLKPRREQVPSDARKVAAQFERIDRPARYEASGPDYMVRWKIL